MKRALFIVSTITLVAVVVAVVGQALLVSLRVYFDPSGQMVNPTPLGVLAAYMAGIGMYAALPLTAATFVLGLVTTSVRGDYLWLVTLIITAVLAMVGLFGMAWILLSVNSPVALVAPLGLVPLVALIYSLRPDSSPLRQGAVG